MGVGVGVGLGVVVSEAVDDDSVLVVDRVLVEVVLVEVEVVLVEVVLVEVAPLEDEVTGGGGEGVSPAEPPKSQDP